MQSASRPSFTNQALAVAVCRGVTVMRGWAMPVVVATFGRAMPGGVGMNAGSPHLTFGGQPHGDDAGRLGIPQGHDHVLPLGPGQMEGFVQAPLELHLDTRQFLAAEIQGGEPGGGEDAHDGHGDGRFHRGISAGTPLWRKGMRRIQGWHMIESSRIAGLAP